MYGGSWEHQGDRTWQLVWTEQAVHNFYLNNVLIHELGHLLDTRNTSYIDRERYAEWFAIGAGYEPTRRRELARRADQQVAGREAKRRGLDPLAGWMRRPAQRRARKHPPISSRRMSRWRLSAFEWISLPSGLGLAARTALFSFVDLSYTVPTCELSPNSLLHNFRSLGGHPFHKEFCMVRSLTTSSLAAWLAI